MAADGRWCHFGRNRGLPNVPVECTAAELWSVCPCFPTVKKAQFKENSARVAIIIVCNFVKFIRAYYNPTKARRSSARIWKLTYPTRVLTADRVGRVALARKSEPVQCSKKDIRTTQSIDVKSTRTAFKRLREHQMAQSVANQIKKLETAGFPEETVAPIVESIVVAFIVESFRHHSLTCLDLCLVMCNLCLICLLRNG